MQLYLYSIQPVIQKNFLMHHQQESSVKICPQKFRVLAPMFPPTKRSSEFIVKRTSKVHNCVVQYIHQKVPGRCPWFEVLFNSFEPQSEQNRMGPKKRLPMSRRSEVQGLSLYNVQIGRTPKRSVEHNVRRDNLPFLKEEMLELGPETCMQ